MISSRKSSQFADCEPYSPTTLASTTAGSNPIVPEEPAAGVDRSVARKVIQRLSRSNKPESGTHIDDETEVSYVEVNHPNHASDLHLLRPAIGNSDGDERSAVRITIQPFLTTKDDVVFYPMVVELTSNGPSVRFARHRRRPNGPTLVQAPSKTEPGRIEFKSRTITRVCHAQMWFEDGKVFIQDTGSSSGTFLNDQRLVERVSTVSPPFEVKDSDIIQIGRDYEQGLKSDAEDKSIFKCIKAKVYIEPCDMQTPKLTVVPTLEPETPPASPATEVAAITFECLPNCTCPWRTLFHRKEIYSLDLAVPNPETISSAIRTWLLSKKGADDRWTDWEEADVVLLMSVVENIIEVVKTSSQDFQPYQSWIRKIARETGALPSTFVLKGVARTSQHAVSGGGFADIYVGKHGGREVALKVLRVFLTPENRKRVFREVAHEALFWKHMEHPHILPFLGISQEVLEPQLSLVSPWMPNGNVLCYMENHDDVDRLSLATQCSQGLRYLHEHKPGLIHGDIKAINILIDEDGNARITDFGLITITESQALETDFTAHTGRGSVRWMAPELFGSGVRINRSTDVYAFGMTIHEIYTNSAPFAGYRNDFQVVMAITQGVRPARPTEVGMYEDLWSLVTRCWEIEPSARPSMKDVEDSLMCLMEQRTRGELVRPDSSLSSDTRTTTAYGDGSSYDTIDELDSSFAAL